MIDVNTFQKNIAMNLTRANILESSFHKFDGKEFEITRFASLKVFDRCL